MSINYIFVRVGTQTPSSPNAHTHRLVQIQVYLFGRRDQVRRLKRNANISRTCGEFNHLATKCKNTSGEPYIKSLKSGTNISIENFSKGFTHVFQTIIYSNVSGICGHFHFEGGQRLLCPDGPSTW
jgi:hypothetical protein